MPSSLGSIPYAGNTSRLSEMLMRQGEQRANAAMRSGDIWGNAIQNVGQSLASGVENFAAARQEQKQQQAMAKRDQAWLSYVDSGEWSKDPESAYKTSVRIWGPGEGPKQFQALQSVNKITGQNPEADRKEFSNIARALKTMTPEAKAQLWPTISALGKKAYPGQPIPDQYSPDADPLIDFAANIGQEAQKPIAVAAGSSLIDPTTGKAVYTAPTPEKAPGTHVVGGNLVDDSGKVLFRAPEKPEGEGKGVWVTRGGQPVHISESQIQPGDTPYESARTAVKKIPAGSAEEIGQFDSGLDDLRLLGESLAGSGATGAMARGGAALPNIVTELTGLGSEAKTKQAQIDRVKQIIGKTLEGGVLRKEDEEKYKKILPTIGDPPELVRQKVKGLEAAIQRKKSRQVDALEDAGYDMEAFRARAAQAAAPVAPVRKKFNPATGMIE